LRYLAYLVVGVAWIVATVALAFSIFGILVLIIGFIVYRYFGDELLAVFRKICALPFARGGAQSIVCVKRE